MGRRRRSIGTGRSGQSHQGLHANEVASTSWGVSLTHLYLAADLVRQPPKLADGKVALPEGPGLGVEIDEGALARFRVRDDARDTAERAMFDHTSMVRRDLAAIMVTIYRDPEHPTQFTMLVRANDAKAEQQYRPIFTAALASHLDGEITFEHSEVVTSSDLQRRHR